MSFIVSIRFKGDAKKAHQVLRDNPDLYEAIHEGIYKAGLIRCARYVSDDGFLDIDEWPSEKERDAFVAQAGPALRRWNELMGTTESETHIWRTAGPGEEF
jgi:hypothetical protein